MLSLSQQIVIEGFIKEFIKLIQNAINTKQIDRVSRRVVNGQVTYKKFKSPVSASGNLAKTLSYQITDTGVSIFANDYVYELVYGRRPQQVAGGNDHNLESDIRKWMDSKGIGESQEIEILGQKVTLQADKDTIASLIANKIRKYGSSIYLASHGNNSGLLENVVSEQLIQEYNANFTKQLGEELRSAFVNG